MKYFTLGYRLPHFLAAPLFGDRKQFGLVVQPNDSCWKNWEKTYLDFYYSNQKQSVGEIVNNAGYQVISRLDLDGKRVLEIGPGDINHLEYWQGTPDCFIIADIQEKILDIAGAKLQKKGIPYSKTLLSRSDRGKLPFEDEEFDIVISFYSLEHLFPLEPYIEGMLGVLKKGGKLIGAIPCEGGLAWGCGRFLTSRRWFKQHTQINPDKIIRWEHPNFADKILKTLDGQMHKQYIHYWPFSAPSIDLNLVVSFIYEKP